MSSPAGMFLYRGLSMWPYFQNGDLLEVQPVTPTALKVGDCVVLLGRDGRHVAHRVVALRGGLRTRGDALPCVDIHAGPPPELVGRIVARYRFGERLAVAGGWAGQLAGIWYRHAGRIDPERGGRGGRLGRMLRAGCTPLLQPLMRYGAARSLVVTGRKELTVWGFGGKVVAVRAGICEEWQVRWPWRLVLARPVEKNPG